MACSLAFVILQQGRVTIGVIVPKCDFYARPMRSWLRGWWVIWLEQLPIWAKAGQAQCDYVL